MREWTVALRSVVPLLKTIVFCGASKPSELVSAEATANLNYVVYKNKAFYHATMALNTCDALVKH